jgi:hypothetical protein
MYISMYRYVQTYTFICVFIFIEYKGGAVFLGVPMYWLVLSQVKGNIYIYIYIYMYYIFSYFYIFIEFKGFLRTVFLGVPMYVYLYKYILVSI